MTEERRGIEEQMKFAQESESEGIKKDERTRYQEIQKEERMKEQEELKKEIAEVCQARMKMEETIKVLYLDKTICVTIFFLLFLKVTLSLPELSFCNKLFEILIEKKGTVSPKTTEIFIPDFQENLLQTLFYF